jgi:AraC-like DNA-binding protein
MTLGRWHQRARLVKALDELARGATVTATALDVGYATPSAFAAAFKKALGCTPSRYFEPGSSGSG